MSIKKQISLRKATIADLEILKHWDEQPHVAQSDPKDDWDWAYELPRELSWREQLIAEKDGEPIGCIQIIDPALEETHYWGDDVPANLRALDIWIGEAENLGQGYGTEMMKQALDKCFVGTKVEAVLIDPLASNTRAHKFYEKLGFKFLRTQDFDGDECFVYQLNRTDWKNHFSENC